MKNVHTAGSEFNVKRYGLCYTLHTVSELHALAFTPCVCSKYQPASPGLLQRHHVGCMQLQPGVLPVGLLAALSSSCIGTRLPPLRIFPAQKGLHSERCRHGTILRAQLGEKEAFSGPGRQG